VSRKSGQLFHFFGYIKFGFLGISLGKSFDLLKILHFSNDFIFNLLTNFLALSKLLNFLNLFYYISNFEKRSF
jgi:hypothetical protein